MGLDMFLYRKTVSEAAYWRKANAIHGWFDHFKDEGLGNCENLEVTIPMLTHLRDDCDTVLASQSEEKAWELLPPTSGFFFGSNEIDDYYWEYLEETSKELTKIINESEEGDLFEYHAWW